MHDLSSALPCQDLVQQTPDQAPAVTWVKKTVSKPLGSSPLLSCSGRTMAGSDPLGCQGNTAGQRSQATHSLRHGAILSRRTYSGESTGKNGYKDTLIAFRFASDQASEQGRSVGQDMRRASRNRGRGKKMGRDAETFVHVCEVFLRIMDIAGLHENATHFPSISNSGTHLCNPDYTS